MPSCIIQAELCGSDAATLAFMEAVTAGAPFNEEAVSIRHLMPPPPDLRGADESMLAKFGDIVRRIYLPRAGDALPTPAETAGLLLKRPLPRTRAELKDAFASWAFSRTPAFDAVALAHHYAANEAAYGAGSYADWQEANWGGPAGTGTLRASREPSRVFLQYVSPEMPRGLVVALPTRFPDLAMRIERVGVDGSRELLHATTTRGPRP
jgi:hypothetical protein